MNKFVVRVYVATPWSLFTKADHYEDFAFQSHETLEAISKRLAREGFRTEGGRKWILPGAILSVEIE